MKKAKTIMLTGGGSGGHLTPVLSVAESLKKIAPEYQLVYVGQKGDGLGDIMHASKHLDAIHTVRAGKLRRYHGEGLRQLLDLKTLFLNTRDIFFTTLGFFQALILLKKVRPQVIFCKGGFVGVPVCLAAALYRIPYVTHDSDAIPGLANRIIGRWATIHTVAMPKEQYKYPAHKTISVGVPVHAGFKKVTPDMQALAKEKLGLPKKAWVLFVIGGGLGAGKINDAVTVAAKTLLDRLDSLYILHVAGRKGEEKAQLAYSRNIPEDMKKRVRVYGFTSDVATMGEAAHVVITRAGATNMAEFSLQGKPCIIVPNPALTGGHQLKNAKVFADAGAALILSEQNLDKLADMVLQLYADKDKQAYLSEQILQFANKNAAESLANVLLTVVKA